VQPTDTHDATARRDRDGSSTSAVSTIATARLTSDADQPLAGSMWRRCWSAVHHEVHPEPRPDPAITHPEPRPDPTATHPEPRPDPTITYPEPRTDPAIIGLDPGAELDRRQRRAARRPPRAQARQVFAELARLAALPPDSYAVDEAVDGAMCLVSTDTGFEVFSASDGVKREARLFNDEEAAYFYLFGLLAAEAVRDGRLVPPWAARASAHLNSYGE